MRIRLKGWRRLVKRRIKRRLSSERARFRLKVANTNQAAKHLAGQQVELIAFSISLSAAFISYKAAGSFEISKDSEGLRTFLSSTGGGLVGATALSFSIIMLAVQLNATTVPYAVLRKLSVDWRLILYFFLSLILAITVTATAWIIEASPAIAIGICVFSIIFSIAVYIFAFIRAIGLINPHEQIRIITRATIKHLRQSKKRADSLRPLVPQNEKDSDHDLQLLRILKENNHWIRAAIDAITILNLYATRAASRGDYDVVSRAFRSIAAINEEYILFKGRTFFNNNPFLENPFASDQLFNSTLELIRQVIDSGLRQLDEALLTKCFDILGQLTFVYAEIPYGNKSLRSADHASLAQAYLCIAVERCVDLKIADLIMCGLRWLGKTGGLLISKNCALEAITALEKIGEVGIAAAKQEGLRAVIPVATEQIGSAVQCAILFDDANSRTFDALATTILQLSLITIAGREEKLSLIHRMNLEPLFGLAPQGKILPLFQKIINHADTNDLRDAGKNIICFANSIREGLQKISLAAHGTGSSSTYLIDDFIEALSIILLHLMKTDISLDQKARAETFVYSSVHTLSKAVLSTGEKHDSENTIELLFGIALQSVISEENQLTKEILDSVVKVGQKASSNDNYTLYRTCVFGIMGIAIASGQQLTKECLETFLSQIRLPANSPLGNFLSEMQQLSKGNRGHFASISSIDQYLAKTERAVFNSAIKKALEVLTA